jgi:hypothetical protein
MEATLRKKHWHEWYVLAEMQKEVDRKDTGEKRQPFDRGPNQEEEEEDGEDNGEIKSKRKIKPKPAEGPRHALREMLLMWKHMLKRGHTARVHHKASSEQGVIDRELQVNRFVFAKHVPTVG